MCKVYFIGGAFSNTRAGQDPYVRHMIGCFPAAKSKCHRSVPWQHFESPLKVDTADGDRFDLTCFRHLRSKRQQASKHHHYGIVECQRRARREQ
ncbi:hypothetical protein F2P79_000616 [Pimephales promelas]|nr:hypothetical protein F2P79_000616 [Pimephales promelas]